MAAPLDINRLTPQERIQLAQELWDSLCEEEIDLTPEQAEELGRRRDRLEAEGPHGRPWRDVVDEFEPRGG